MSASLVGSEMCIRDSHAQGESGAGRQGYPEGRAERRARLLISSGRRGPVSYTHLTLPTICSV
eukprot:11861611-Alexandrium_andersonii.AAC.1